MVCYVQLYGVYLARAALWSIFSVFLYDPRGKIALEDVVPAFDVSHHHLPLPYCRVSFPLVGFGWKEVWSRSQCTCLAPQDVSTIHSMHVCIFSSVLYFKGWVYPSNLLSIHTPALMFYSYMHGVSMVHNHSQPIYLEHVCHYS